MGKRRRRRTRSDDTGDGDGRGWPVFRHNQWTYEGGLERAAAFGRGARLIRARGGRRAISNRDLVVPILTTTALLTGLVALVAVGLQLLF